VRLHDFYSGARLTPVSASCADVGKHPTGIGVVRGCRESQHTERDVDRRTFPAKFYRLICRGFSSHELRSSEEQVNARIAETVCMRGSDMIAGERLRYGTEANHGELTACKVK
jgi:hypothetical protein